VRDSGGIGSGIQVVISCQVHVSWNSNLKTGGDRPSIHNELRREYAVDCVVLGKIHVEGATGEARGDSLRGET